MNAVYIKNNSISRELCEKIIILFEESSRKYGGITMSGLNKNIKNTLDLRFDSSNPEQVEFDNIYKILADELHINVNKYLKLLNNNIFNKTPCTLTSFQIQKYKKKEGKYIYHNDSLAAKSEFRIITFLWYLNDVYEGGETELLYDNVIKPEMGKLLLFPANTTYPHCGKMPISNDKYIITGWIYMSSDKYCTFEL
jgi:hypothetical protein